MTDIPMIKASRWKADCAAAIDDLRSYTGLLDHLAVSELQPGPNDITIIGRSMDRPIADLEALVEKAAEVHAAEIDALKAELAALRAAKAATGSAEAQQHVAGLYAILRSAVAVVADGCHQAGYELPGWTKGRQQPKAPD